MIRDTPLNITSASGNHLKVQCTHVGIQSLAIDPDGHTELVLTVHTSEQTKLSVWVYDRMGEVLTIDIGGLFVKAHLVQFTRNFTDSVIYLGVQSWESFQTK